MFARRIVTKAVSKNCMFCDACMKMINDDDEYVIMSFTPTSGPTYTQREVKKTEKFTVCHHCYEVMTGSYIVHKQMVMEGSEKIFEKEGITEQEMKALLQFKPTVQEEVRVEKKSPIISFLKRA